jgi:hypothetical protein
LPVGDVPQSTYPADGDARGQAGAARSDFT